MPQRLRLYHQCGASPSLPSRNALTAPRGVNDYRLPSYRTSHSSSNLPVPVKSEPVQTTCSLMMYDLSFFCVSAYRSSISAALGTSAASEYREGKRTKYTAAIQAHLGHVSLHMQAVFLVIESPPEG
jgi:hypothetical protein